MDTKLLDSFLTFYKLQNSKKKKIVPLFINVNFKNNTMDILLSMSYDIEKLILEKIDNNWCLLLNT